MNEKESNQVNAFAVQISRELGALTTAVSQTRDEVRDTKQEMLRQTQAIWKKIEDHKRTTHEEIESFKIHTSKNIDEVKLESQVVKLEQGQIRRDMKWVAAIIIGVMSAVKWIASKLFLLWR